MSGSQIVLRLYFGLAVPLLGGLGVAYGGYELLGLSFSVTLLLGALYGFAAFYTGPMVAPPLSLRETFGVVLWGTLPLASIPVATGVAFYLAERFGSLPSLVVPAVVALGTTALAAVLLRGGGEGEPSPLVDRVLRGRQRGGNVEYAQRLRAEEERRAVAAQNRRAG